MKPRTYKLQLWASTDAFRDFLRAEAKKRRVTQSALVERAVRELVERENATPKPAPLFAAIGSTVGRCAYYRHVNGAPILCQRVASGIHDGKPCCLNCLRDMYRVERGVVG